MGEKGNVTSEELVSAVVVPAGTQVTAVFEEAAGAITDKVIDKGADAGIDTATEKWKQRTGDDPDDGPAQS